MSAIFQLLTELSVDPFCLEDFLRDPDPLIASRGVGSEDIPAIMRPGAIPSDGTWARGAGLLDPGYDPLPYPDVPESPEQDLR